MFKTYCGLALAAFLLCDLILFGSSATAQSVVQLPSISQFQYNGSVMVPDGGTTSLGGVNRSAFGSTQRGRNRAFGSVLGRSNASATVTIIDHDEIDRRLRGIGPENRNGKPRNTVANAKANPKAVDPDREGKALVRYARAQYKEGKQRTSFEAYRLAISVLSPKLKTLAEAEFRRTFGTAAVQANSMPGQRRF